MKQAVLTTILLCVVAMANAQEMPWFMHGNEAAQFKGKVKEVRAYYPEMREDPELDTDYYFYTYDLAGRLVSEYINNVSKICWITYYWSTHLDSIIGDGDCYSFAYYSYDANDQLEYVVSGVPSRMDTVKIIYDKRGFPVAIDDTLNQPWYEWYNDGRYKGHGNKYWGVRYEYDSIGRLVKEIYQNGLVCIYTYNEQGDVSQKVSDPNGNLYCYHCEVTTETYTYKYDEHNNWTELYVNGVLRIIRKITYYEE